MRHILSKDVELCVIVIGGKNCTICSPTIVFSALDPRLDLDRIVTKSLILRSWLVTEVDA